jgi:hypothetical protein
LFPNIQALLLATLEEEDRKLTPEELASLREALPIWQRGHTLHARLMKDGKVQFVDLV